MSATSLADQLELVLDGRMPLEDVLASGNSTVEPLINCFHGLQHFLADEDIRAKDAGYRRMQVSEMRKLIGLLRSGADGKTLSKISLLGLSHS